MNWDKAFFFGEAKLTPLGDTRLFHLDETFSYFDGEGVEHKIECGLLLDFASVPRVGWNIFPPMDPRYRDAAALHDMFYFSHSVSRARADYLLREAAAVLGSGWVRRNAIWSAVRIGGGGAYETGPARQVANRKHARDAGWL